MITNSPDVARFAIDSGVDQVFVDLEIIGKSERQGHLDTVISKHTLQDVQRVRNAIPKGCLLVRINPIHADSKTEIEGVIAAGADVLMLPMFKGPQDVAIFTSLVAGRARCCLLVETVAAMQAIRDCLAVSGVDQVHIGLNDLHLELGMEFMFQPLASGMLDQLCRYIREAGIPFGIGGLARVGEGMLPAELLLAEHVRLGSTWAILSRTFHRQAISVEEIRSQMDFAQEIGKLRQVYSELLSASTEDLERLHEKVQIGVASVVSLIRARKGLTN
jgi:hypothetical protein